VPAQRQLAEQRPRPAAVADLARGNEDADGDGQVVRRAALAPIGRREVDRDARRRVLEAAVADRAADSLARFRQAASGRPTMWQAGIPGATSTSTRISSPRRPLTTAVTRVASTGAC
jgi:hypothetical protein